jgi:hypothetical protein
MGERRISSGCGPYGPAACRIPQAKARRRSARSFARSLLALRQQPQLFSCRASEGAFQRIGSDSARIFPPAPVEVFLARSISETEFLLLGRNRIFDLARRPRILALEQRILFLPAMDFVASGTFKRVHLLDGQCPKGLRIHREACVDQFSGIRALDDDPVQLPLSSGQQEPCLQGKFRDQSSLLVASFFAGLTNSRTGMCHPARRVWMLSLWTPGRSGV